MRRGGYKKKRGKEDNAKEEAKVVVDAGFIIWQRLERARK